MVVGPQGERYIRGAQWRKAQKVQPMECQHINLNPKNHTHKVDKTIKMAINIRGRWHLWWLVPRGGKIYKGGTVEKTPENANNVNV